MTLGVIQNLISVRFGLSPYGEALEHSTQYSSPLIVAKKLHFNILHNTFSHV